MEISCKTCTHKKVCDLWREKECQSAKNFFNDECELYAAEPKKGKWMPVTVSSGRDSWRCSVCGRHARGKTKNLPYCHCGAKMEGSE